MLLHGDFEILRPVDFEEVRDVAGDPNIQIWTEGQALGCFSMRFEQRHRRSGGVTCRGRLVLYTESVVSTARWGLEQFEGDMVCQISLGEVTPKLICRHKWRARFYVVRLFESKRRLPNPYIPEAINSDLSLPYLTNSTIAFSTCHAFQKCEIPSSLYARSIFGTLLSVP